MINEKELLSEVTRMQRTAARIYRETGSVFDAGVAEACKEFVKMIKRHALPQEGANEDQEG